MPIATPSQSAVDKGASPADARDSAARLANEVGRVEHSGVALAHMLLA